MVVEDDKSPLVLRRGRVFRTVRVRQIALAVVLLLAVAAVIASRPRKKPSNPAPVSSRAVVRRSNKPVATVLTTTMPTETAAPARAVLATRDAKEDCLGLLEDQRRFGIGFDVPCLPPLVLYNVPVPNMEGLEESFSFTRRVTPEPSPEGANASVFAPHWCVALCVADLTCDAIRFVREHRGDVVCTLYVAKDTPVHESSVGRLDIALPMAKGATVQVAIDSHVLSAIKLVLPDAEQRGGSCPTLLSSTRYASAVKSIVGTVGDNAELPCLSDAELLTLFTPVVLMRRTVYADAIVLHPDKASLAVLHNASLSLARRICLSMQGTCASVACLVPAASATMCYLSSRLIDTFDQEWSQHTVDPATAVFVQNVAPVAIRRPRRSRGFNASVVFDPFQWWLKERASLTCTVPVDGREAVSLLALPSLTKSRCGIQGYRRKRTVESVVLDATNLLMQANDMAADDCWTWCEATDDCDASSMNPATRVCVLLRSPLGLLATGAPGSECLPLIRDATHAATDRALVGIAKKLRIETACASAKDMDRVFSRIGKTAIWATRPRLFARVKRLHQCLALCTAFAWCLSVQWSKGQCSLFSIPFLAARGDGGVDASTLVSSFSVVKTKKKPTVAVGLIATQAPEDGDRVAVAVSTWARPPLRGVVLEHASEPPRTFNSTLAHFRAANQSALDSTAWRLVDMLCDDLLPQFRDANWFLIASDTVHVFRTNLAAVMESFAARAPFNDVAFYIGQVETATLRGGRRIPFASRHGGIVLLNRVAVERLKEVQSTCSDDGAADHLLSGSSGDWQQQPFIALGVCAAVAGFTPIALVDVGVAAVSAKELAFGAAPGLDIPLGVPAPSTTAAREDLERRERQAVEHMSEGDCCFKPAQLQV